MEVNKEKNKSFIEVRKKLILLMTKQIYDAVHLFK